MGARRESREAAVQLLYSIDAGNLEDFEEGCELFWSLRNAKPRIRERGSEMARGIFGHLDEIDEVLVRSTQNYQVERISVVDRNILRLAVYEMLFEEEIPDAVSINEAIEIAKGFGTPESGRFVNGVLDRARRDLQGAGPKGSEG